MIRNVKAWRRLSPESALAKGYRFLFLWRTVMERCGTAWSMWTPLDTLEGRVHAMAMGLVRKHGLEVDEDAVRSRVTRRVVRCLVEGWIPFLSHYKFGRGHHAWRFPEKYQRLTLAEAEAKIDAEKQRLRVARELANAERKVKQLQRREKVHALHAAGLGAEEIAREVGVNRATVFRDLKARS